MKTDWIEAFLIMVIGSLIVLMAIVAIDYASAEYQVIPRCDDFNYWELRDHGPILGLNDNVGILRMTEAESDQECGGVNE